MNVQTNPAMSREDLINLGRSVAARSRPGFEIEDSDGTVRPVTNIEMAAFSAFTKQQRLLQIERGECCGRVPHYDGTCLGQRCPAHAAKTFCSNFLKWMEETTNESVGN